MSRLRIPPSRQRGFTLAEMLVGMVVGLIVLAIVSLVFLKTQGAFSLQTRQSELAEEGRFGVDFLKRIVGQAGYLSTDTSKTKLLPTALNASPIQYSASSKTLTLTFQADAAMRDCADGTLTAASPPVNQTIALAYDSSNGKITCKYSGDAAASDLIGGTGSPVNVAAMQWKLGVDDTASTGEVFCDYGSAKGDCVADHYYAPDASQMAGTDMWKKVVSVRACFMLETRRDIFQGAQSYTVVDCDGAVTTVSSAKLRRAFTTTISLRNKPYGAAT